MKHWERWIGQLRIRPVKVFNPYYLIWVIPA